MGTTDDPELAEFEARRRANLKTFALIGLVAICAILLWRCTSLVDRFGVGVGGSGKAAPPGLALSVGRGGAIAVEGCGGPLEDCIARAKVRSREGGTRAVPIHVEPGAAPEAVASLQALVASYELIPVVD